MRKFTIGIVAAIGLWLGGCTTNPTTGYQQIDPNVIGQIQADVAAACGIVPTVTTILSVFIPGAASAISAATTVICAAVHAAPASSRMLAASSSLHPVVVGVLPNGVSITGYKARLR